MGKVEEHNGRRFWTDGHCGGFVIGGADVFGHTPALFRWLVEKFEIASVMDIGCGEAHALASFLTMGPHMTGIGLDGSERAIRDTAAKGCVIQHDFNDGPYMDATAGLCWSCECLEHIEEKYLPNVMGTIQAAGCRVVAVTAAPPGQPGWNHVNCQPVGYWIERFRCAGYRYDDESTRIGKLIAAGYRRKDMEPYFVSSGLVFQADSPLS